LAIRVYGTLDDLNESNGNRVKFQVRADGQSPTVYNAPTDQDRSIPDRIYPPYDTTVVARGYYRTCQVNILADGCTAWTSKVNPYG
jgi:hypothetical protein